MAEYSKLARGHFTYSGSGSKTIYLPFVPQLVRATDNTIWGNPSVSKSFSSYWDESFAQGTCINGYWATLGTSPTTDYQTAGFVSSGGISTFSCGLSGDFGPQQQIIGATAANPPVFNVTAHGYAIGDVVTFEGLYQSYPTMGMPQMAGMLFTIISTSFDANHFAVNWNASGSNYTALSASPSGAFVKKVLNPYLYQPGDYFISAVASSGIYTQITMTTNHNLVLNSTVAFRIPRVWGPIQLNAGNNPLSPGAINYCNVISVVDAFNVVVNFPFSYLTPFNANVPTAVVPGLSFPQIVAVGDQNTGGGNVVINGMETTNGPALSGSFVNNTRQGFILGTGSVLAEASTNDSISWEALYYDLTIND